MSENTKIEWADHTFNPWEGCQKVGPGCDHCYAETRNARFAGGTALNWGPGAPRRRTSAANWNKPLAWNAAATEFQVSHGRRQRVFCASLADVFDNQVDQQWRDDLFSLIEATPHLDWLLLTKRIGNVGNMLPVPFSFATLYPNVWIGITVVNQAEADRDIPKLLKVDAAKRFLSMEPLLGPVDLNQALPPVHCETCNADYGALSAHGAGKPTGLDWVIVGGESGPGARPMSPEWARELRDQCTGAGVPFLFKQWGEWLPMLGQADGVTVAETLTMQDGWVMGRAGKKAAGRRLDGHTWDEVPA
ncbi:phage Gp37/Gp68 family protein [Herbaspirillum sp. WKF16]|uniref:phage Gp37/Gp68 family protein n=1 Tax=Herbaspirillum sp. WKF16 TaxID=3028312 RepID=UPI0023A9CA07|nr:phage Gp37/Gp68 family protein [Herbaspirillum sp. WKF16]WDZ97935.1 phage Gp37/Gp68 family protein [Herbaspirillum sp. WKF16]